MTITELSDIIENIQKKIRDDIHSSNLLALALTGSRAGGYCKENSDYDFFAILKDNIPFRYIDFFVNEKEISVKIEGKNIFEKNIKNKLHIFAEQGSFVWLPYISFVGEEYLKNIEQEARNILLEDFISILPENIPVIISKYRIAEFPLIEEAYVWPSSCNRLRAIAYSKNDPFKDIVDKYAEALEQKGFKTYDSDHYILINNKRKKTTLSSFSNNLFLESKRYVKKNKIISLKQIFYGSVFLLSQIPEKFFNLFYHFPKYICLKDQLIYYGPPLKEYVESRKYLNIFRDINCKVKKKLLSF